MTCHQQIFRSGARGFNAFENLVFIVVLGVITLAAVPMLKRTTNEAQESKAKRNAQTICGLYNSARSVGVVFSAPSKAGIVNQLMAGGTGSSISDLTFQMTELTGTELVHALRYCRYDPMKDDLSYNPAGDEPLEEIVVQEPADIDEENLVGVTAVDIVEREPQPWRRLDTWFTVDRIQSERVLEYVRKNPEMSELGVSFGRNEWRSEQGDDGLWWPEYRPR